MSKYFTRREMYSLLGFVVFVCLVGIVVNFAIIISRPKDAKDSSLEVVKSPEEYTADSKTSLSGQIDSPDGLAYLTLEEAGQKYSLSLSSNSGELIKDFDSEEILNAAFGSNDLVYYQKAGDDFGIFTYNIADATSQKIIESTDSQFFKNIAFIDNDKYFFIEPKTGKYGFGYVSGKSSQYLGQEVVETGSVVETDIAAFSNPVINTSKTNLFVVRKSILDGSIILSIEGYSLETNDFDDPIYQKTLGNDFGKEVNIEDEIDIENVVQ